MAVITKIIIGQPPAPIESPSIPESVRGCLRSCWQKRPRPSISSHLPTLTAAKKKFRNRLSIESTVSPGVTVVVEPAPPLPQSNDYDIWELGIRRESVLSACSSISEESLSSVPQYSYTQTRPLGAANDIALALSAYSRSFHASV